MDSSIASRIANVDGLELHYLTAGQGPAVVLLHGYAETSRMWRPLIPLLAGRFTVIAPDLPGIGESAIPANGLDMKTAAIRMHALVRSLGIETAEVVGHDIGLMVAYAYAAQFPKEVGKLAVMDAFLPGVGEWEAVYNNPGIWHFRFNGPTPEALVHGRERTYFEYFWNDLAADKNRSIPDEDRKAYISSLLRARAHAGRMGLLRLVHPSCQRFRATRKDQAHHACPLDWWGEIVGGRSGPTDEASGYRRKRDRPERYGTLDHGRAPQGNHGRVGQISLTPRFMFHLAGRIRRA